MSVAYSTHLYQQKRSQKILLVHGWCAMSVGFINFKGPMHLKWQKYNVVISSTITFVLHMILVKTGEKVTIHHFYVVIKYVS
jgi:hypothetical protein